MNARHRVSKMLLRHGRVYPEPSTWTEEHRRWLARQQFPEPVSELAYADLVACVDGLTVRKHSLAERIGELASDPQWWPTVARLRAFRGVDTLTALAIHLELGADWHRFEKAHRLGSWLGLTPSRWQSGESDRTGSITKTGSMLARRLLVESAWHYARDPGSARRCGTARTESPITCCRSPTAPSIACTASTFRCAAAASRTTWP